MIRIGSHNSWSSSRPVWWLGPFRWIGRCQSLSVREQYEMGVRLFDLRVRFDRYEDPYFCHGLMRYRGDVMGELAWISQHSTVADRIYVRVMFEDLPWTRGVDYPLYAEFCDTLTKCFRTVVFFGGNSRRFWKSNFYHFSANVSYIEKHGSVCSKKIWERLVPWFYAKRMNELNKSVTTGFDFLMIDFVKLS